MKRGLLLALILANLGLFAWYHWYVTPNRSEPALAPPLAGQPLKLVNELSPAELKAAANAVQAAPAPATVAAAPAATHTVPAPTTAGIAAAAAQVCASYGPFPSADAANLGLSRLKLLGLTASQRTVPGKAKLGYWVYLPPFGSRKEADAAAALLKKKGVSDIYVVADEANRNALSLGVFSQKGFAEQREKEIRKLGFRALLADRFRDEPRYWLDARGVQGALPAAETFKDLGEEGTPVGMVSSGCAG
ncbi:MAG TPA: SPOR domain-containing protein [Gammaproteobacteria bacterium]|jgi:hypothetical protein